MNKHTFVDSHLGRARWAFKHHKAGILCQKYKKVMDIARLRERHLITDKRVIRISDAQLDLLGNRYLEQQVKRVSGVSFEAYLLEPQLYDAARSGRN